MKSLAGKVQVSRNKYKTREKNTKTGFLMQVHFTKTKRNHLQSRSVLKSHMTQTTTSYTFEENLTENC